MTITALVIIINVSLFDVSTQRNDIDLKSVLKQANAYIEDDENMEEEDSFYDIMSGIAEGLRSVGWDDWADAFESEAYSDDIFDDGIGGNYYKCSPLYEGCPNDYNMDCNFSETIDLSIGGWGAKVTSHDTDYDQYEGFYTQSVSFEFTGPGAGISAELCVTRSNNGQPIPGDECKAGVMWGSCMPCDLCEGDFNF